VAKPADHSGYLRVAVVKALRADADLTAWFGEAIYGRRVPADHPWPFIRVETATTEAFETSGVVGGSPALTVNSFAKGETAQEDVDRYNRRVAAVLDDAKPAMELDAGETGEIPHVVELSWTRSNVIRDTATPGAYHGATDFTATTAVSR
jgi:Protein of unknown function (DUF3168)